MGGPLRFRVAKVDRCGSCGTDFRLVSPHAVVSSMKRASNKMPEEAPPRYGNMSDAEFTKELAKLGC